MHMTDQAQWVPASVRPALLIQDEASELKQLVNDNPAFSPVLQRHATMLAMDA